MQTGSPFWKASQKETVRVDITNLPMVSYFTDWKNVTGTYILGFLGLIVTLIACVACWYQIKNTKDEE